MHSNKNIYKSLYSLILSTIVSKRFLRAFFVVLNNSCVSLNYIIYYSVFFEWNIFYDNRRRKWIILISFYNSSKLGISFLKNLKSFFSGNILNLDSHICCFQCPNTFDYFSILISISRFEI